MLQIDKRLIIDSPNVKVYIIIDRYFLGNKEFISLLRLNETMIVDVIYYSFLDRN